MKFGDGLLYPEESHAIVGCMYTVHNILGYGFREKVYESALAIELRRNGLKVVQQQPIKVRYRGAIIGDYYADILVNGRIILEIKAGRGIVEDHLIQLTNYLKATDIELGMVLNFGQSAEFKRRVFTNKNSRKSA